MYFIVTISLTNLLCFYIVVGLGKLTPDDVAMILNARGRTEICAKQPYKAPARGLCLDYCIYNKIDDYIATSISNSDKFDYVISKATSLETDSGGETEDIYGNGDNEKKLNGSVGRIWEEGGMIDLPVLRLDSIETNFGEQTEDIYGDKEKELKVEAEERMWGEGEVVKERRCSIMSNLNSSESEENNYGMESGEDDYDDDSVVSEEVTPMLGPVFQHFSLKKTVRYDDACSPASPKLFRPLEQLIAGDDQDGDICTALKSVAHMRYNNGGDSTNRSGDDSARFSNASNSTLSNASSNSIYSSSIVSYNSILTSSNSVIEKHLTYKSNDHSQEDFEQRNSRNQSPLSDMNSEKSAVKDEDEFGSSDDEEEDNLVIEEGYEEIPNLAYIPSPRSFRSTNDSNDNSNNNSDGEKSPTFSLKLPSDLQTR
jgi:hypothetical protein